MASLKEAQEKVVHYQVLGQKLQALDNRRQLLINKLMEVNSTISTVEELETSDKEKEILLPLGSGVYINGSIKDKEKIIVMLSREIAVDMNMKNTKETLGKNKKTLENGLRVVEDEMLRTQDEMQKLEPEVRDFVERQEKLSQSQA